MFSLVVAVSQCAPGRFGTVDQYRPAFVSEDGDDRSDPDELHDGYYDPDYRTDSDDAVEVVSEEPQMPNTQMPGEEHATSDDRDGSECRTTTDEPTTDAQTTAQVPT